MHTHVWARTHARMVRRCGYHGGMALEVLWWRMRWRRYGAGKFINSSDTQFVPRYLRVSCKAREGPWWGLETYTRTILLTPLSHIFKMQIVFAESLRNFLQARLSKGKLVDCFEACVRRTVIYDPGRCGPALQASRVLCAFFQSRCTSHWALFPIFN